MAISLGEKAPSFTLYNSDKEEVSLEDFRGKNVVLLFFPMAFTGVCTLELRKMTEDLSQYDSLEAQVLGVSVDSPFTLAKFKESEGFKFPLLSDFNKDVSRAYDALYEDFVMGMKGVSKRSAFVIDEKGIIRYAEVLEDAGKQPDYDKIKEALKKIAA